MKKGFINLPQELPFIIMTIFIHTFSLFILTVARMHIYTIITVNGNASRAKKKGEKEREQIAHAVIFVQK